MRRIFTFVFSVVFFLAFSVSSFGQNNNPTTCSVTPNQCGLLYEAFDSDPISKGYALNGFAYATTQNNGRITINTGAVNTNYSFTTPSFYNTSFGSKSLGFSFSTATGSNNIFAGSNTVPVTINVINASDVIIASCSPLSISAAGTYCVTLTDADLLVGGMYKYQFVFNSGTVSGGTIAIDDLTAGTNQQAPLPVKFANFSAKKANNGVNLVWTIDAEENTKGYDVERSADGRSFASIGTVAATGSRAYDFTDVRPLTDGYYRIRAIDHDGQSGLSNVVRMKGSESEVVIKGFFSNRNQITVQHDAAVDGTVLSVVTADGKLVRNINVVKGSQITQIDVSSAQPGLLVVRYQSKDKVETMKLVKQ
jgi:hypothetical protein